MDHSKKYHTYDMCVINEMAKISPQFGLGVS